MRRKRFAASFWFAALSALLVVSSCPLNSGLVPEQVELDRGKVPYSLQSGVDSALVYSTAGSQEFDIAALSGDRTNSVGDEHYSSLLGHECLAFPFRDSYLTFTLTPSSAASDTTRGLLLEGRVLVTFREAEVQPLDSPVRIPAELDGIPALYLASSGSPERYLITEQGVEQLASGTYLSASAGEYQLREGDGEEPPLLTVTSADGTKTARVFSDTLIIAANGAERRVEGFSRRRFATDGRNLYYTDEADRLHRVFDSGERQPTEGLGDPVQACSGMQGSLEAHTSGEAEGGEE